MIEYFMDVTERNKVLNTFRSIFGIMILLCRLTNGLRSIANRMMRAVLPLLSGPNCLVTETCVIGLLRQ